MASVPSAKHFTTSTFSVGKRWSCLARHLPRFAATPVLAGPNTSWVPGQTGPVPRQKEHGGSPLDGLGHIGVKRIELQLRPLATAAKPISRYRLDSGSRPPLACPPVTHVESDAA